ncbi:MAG: S-methyl-5-thioribose-1-phosphate isomerase [Thermoanaerobaculia bacterium]
MTPYLYSAGRLRLLDQRRLPHEEVFLECDSAAQTAEAIRSLAVRGAPLIGVAAAYGLCVEARRVAARVPEDLEIALALGAERLVSARPTAVNLAWAVGRMRAVAAASANGRAGERVLRLEEEAHRIAEEDRLACLAIGRLGAAWLRARWSSFSGVPTVLTHCNAGALATAGIGTALGIVRVLAAEGPLAVLADETRPYLQGARLTAWELRQDGLDVTLLPDVAAASLIARGRVQGVIVGADRIAANGDVANKVGTYGLALACRAHGVPFLVAAPTTTIDLATRDGASIPIEERDGAEVVALPLPGGGTASLAPAGVSALYPAFDVTPAALVDAIVTERGVSGPPHAEALARFLS